MWNEGEVVFLPHATERMDEGGVDANDVQHVIRFGKIVSHEKPGALWRYRLKGKTVDGERLGVVVEIDARLIIVTVLTR